MTERGSKGVAITNWLVAKTSGVLERKTSRRGFLIGSAMAGSAVVVAGCAPVTRPGAPYTHITDCRDGLCTDGWTEFCCTINDGLNACPPDSFWGGWWRADYSTFCNGTRYYIDCMQYCCGPATGYGNFCAGCSECRCANGCESRHIYCNYFRYGQCHTEIVQTGPIACRVVLCVPPYAIDPACSTATLVDNDTAEHTSPCITTPQPSMPRVAAATSPAPGTAFVFTRATGGAVQARYLESGTWSDPTTLSLVVNSALAAASDATGTYVFGRVAGDTMSYESWDGTDWSGPIGMGALVIGSDPVAVTAPGGVYVFALDAAGQLWHGRFSGGTWSGWFPMQGTWTKDIAAVSTDWGLYVFARGTDDVVQLRQLSGGSWGPWISTGGQASAAPAACADATGISLFVRAGGAVWTRRFNGSFWSFWKTLSGNITGDPAAAVTSHGVRVFADTSVDGGVWMDTLGAAGWGGFQSLHWATSGSPTALADADGETVHLFVRGTDDNLFWGHVAGGAFSGFTNLGGPVAVGNALA